MAAVELAYDRFDSDVDPNACPIILMHGLFWNKFVLRDTGEKLSQAMKCRVYSLDLRNHGESPTLKDVSVELMAEDVKKFLQDKGIEKVNFVCHSFSSKIAYSVLLDEPDKVQKVVMVDCPPFFSYNEMQTTEIVAPQVISQNRMLRTLDAKMSLSQAKSKFYCMAAKAEKSLEYIYKKAAYDLTKVNGEFKWKLDLDYLLQKYIDKHFTPKARGSSNHEILVVRCVNSKHVWDEKFDGILKHNPRAKLVTFEDTTHLLMFERQEKFIEIAKEFFSSPSDGMETKRTV